MIQMQESPSKFEGDFSSLWRLDVMPPIHGLSWWWYWVLILVPDPENPKRSRQLMTLWSTKETKAVRVSGHWWKPGSRMHKDEHGGFVIPGMVCAWWYAGETMHAPLTMRECRMAVVGDEHPLWPDDGVGLGAGAVVPIDSEDLSMGMSPGNESMWDQIGTPSYMAPELLLGQAFNRKVDVYAFGVLLGEVMTGEVPFLGYDYADLKRKVPRGERPSLPRYDCPESIKRLVEDCWHTSDKNRPDFDDVVYDLDRVEAPTTSHTDVLSSLEFGGGDCLDMLMTHK